MRRNLWRVAVACILVLLLAGCLQYSGVSTPHETSIPKMNDLASLQFESSEIEQRMKALDSCCRNLAGAGWTYHPYRQIGNFYSASWCSGAGAQQDCVIAEGTADVRDQHAIELYTLFYPVSFPQVFGLGLHALWVPPAEGWGANLSYDEQGKTIVGDNLSLDFSYYTSPTGAPQDKIHLGSGVQYQVEHTSVVVSSDLSLREEMTRYIASPESMRDRGLAMLDALSTKVESTVQSHQAEKCEYGPYKGGGIPPACNPRPLTPAEETEALATARSYFARQKQLLNRYYKDMYASLMNAFPLNTCWK